MTRPNESGGGAMTGATGDLTPDDVDRPFVPAEQRVMTDPEGEEDVSPPPDDAEPPAPDAAPHVAGAGVPAEGDGDERSDHEEHF